MMLPEPALRGTESWILGIARQAGWHPPCERERATWAALAWALCNDSYAASILRGAPAPVWATAAGNGAGLTCANRLFRWRISISADGTRFAIERAALRPGYEAAALTLALPSPPADEAPHE